MSTDPGSDGPSARRTVARATQVIVVSSVMFTFISYWRTAAVVLCDMSSTAYYIGGIVEQAIGPAAPWFIVGVLLFSSVVRLVYVESCSLFVRGGVYRVVKNAIGGFMGKLAVSALLFDYILTGPISSVCAGQYIISLGLDSLKILSPSLEVTNPAVAAAIRAWGSVLIACLITLYFFRLNIRGIHESSGKALKIMRVTAVMGAIIIGWGLVTLAINGPLNSVPLAPDLNAKVEAGPNGMLVPKQDPITGEQVDPLGFLARLLPASAADSLRNPTSWLSLIGLIGVALAFGHSILAMSGEETLAQVYREVESPKLPNFKKAALVVFVFSLLLTGSISFLAVMLIPNDVRMKLYADNLIGGLAMNVIGWPSVRLLLNAFVVLVGFLLLSGAVNTAIIGSNGVLHRVAEDGVLTSWFLRPHRKYGTAYRLLYLIVGLQLLTIVISGGSMLLLGEAYAFGVVWSFVFQALAMVVLRFKDPRPREFKVPLNVRVGKYEVPIGLGLILLVLLTTAVLNFLTKEVATVAGLTFTAGFMIVFVLSERYHHKRRRGEAHEHIEQFNQELTQEPTPASLGLTHPYRKLVAIRSPQNLFMLETALAETDPATTDLVVMTAKTMLSEGGPNENQDLDTYDQRLMTAVVERAELAGIRLVPLIVPTNNPLHAVLKTAQELQVQELIVGGSNKFTADEQFDQISFFWVNLCAGHTAPLTVRILSRQRDVSLDIAGGNRIPKVTERRARSVADLRAAGVGVKGVLMIHDGGLSASDLFLDVLTMLDPAVVLDLVSVTSSAPQADGHAAPPSTLAHDVAQAAQIGREIHVLQAPAAAADVLQLIAEGEYDLIVVQGANPQQSSLERDALVELLLRESPCPIFVARGF
ncbi:MAG: APC family permease [Planctomycetes bacterium]|nr:APC family permease [Planctomycetota bacterium]